MINPSIHGWIDKFFAEQNQSEHSFPQNDTDFYARTRATGFIFGHIISFDTTVSIENKDRFPQEISKLGMLNTLYQMYRLIRQTNDSEDFITEAVSFYNSMIPKGFNPLKKMLESSSLSSKLEKIIHDRVQTNEDMFS